MPRKPKRAVCEICGTPETAERPLLEVDGHLVCNDCFKEQEAFINSVLARMEDDFDRKAGLKPKKTENEATGPKVVPSPRELKGFLDQYIVGQDEAKRVLAVAVHNHYKRIQSRGNQKEDGDVELEKSNILLVGPTGSGKTLLARTLARVLNVPFAIADATTITEAGYVGEDVENILLNLIRAAEMDVAKAEKGIIFIDEIDKIARKTGNVSITRDVSGEGVQQALLKILEGTEAHVPPAGGRKHPEQTYINIQTKDILFICGGAFVGLDKILEKRSSKNTFGFASNETGKASDAPAKTIRPEPEDFIEFGLIPEFIGRLPVVSTLRELTEDDLVHILTEPKNSLVKQYTKLFSLENIALDFEPGALRAIAHEAVVRKTGARGLRAILEDLMTDLMFDAAGSSDAPTPARRLVLTEELVLRVLRHEGGSLADALVPA